MAELHWGLYSIVEAQRPVTVRQVFYRAVSAGLVDKTEQEYKGTVGRLLVDMRRSGAIPYTWIADSTRWMRKPQTYSNIEQAAAIWQRHYRRALWDNQDTYVEIWLEKEALAGVLVDVTDRWDVPLMVTRGYPSLTFLHSAAELITAIGKPTAIHYFGDYDPSGVDIPRKVEEGLNEFTNGVNITFTIEAVTPELIADLNLPTRPTKASDSRSRTFAGESVEVDAIEPDDLRTLCEDAIQEHVDPEQLAVTEAAEASEVTILQRIREVARGAA